MSSMFKMYKKLDRKFKKQYINENRPCKPNAPLSKTNPNRIRLALNARTIGMCATWKRPHKNEKWN